MTDPQACICSYEHHEDVGTHDTVTGEWLADKPTTFVRRIPVDNCPVHHDVDVLLKDWLITVVTEHPKRLGGWKVLYCCPPRIWRALIV